MGFLDRSIWEQNPNPYNNAIDGITQAPEWGTAPPEPDWWTKAYQKQDELGLTPGMEGTTTMYESTPSWGSSGAKPNFTSTPTNPNAKSITFYSPDQSKFVQPTQGWDRFLNQALQGNIQEEYLNPNYTGQWGKDTSNFDLAQNLDPFKKDWNTANPYFKQMPKNGIDWVNDVLMNPGFGILAGGLGAVVGGPALSASGAFGGTGEAAVGNAAMAAAGGEGAASVLPAGMADAAASIAPAAVGEAGMSMAPSAFGPAMDAALAPTLGAGTSAAAGPIASGIAGAAGGAGSSLWETVSNAVKNMGSTAMENFQKDPVGTLGKIISAAWQNQQARDMEQENKQRGEDLVNRSDPFGPERPYYQDLLEQSYKDPMSLYNSPEYQGLANLFTEQINRRDAAKGRTVAGELPRTMELQDNFMKWLDSYRSGLQKAAGTGMDPSSAGSAAMSNASNAMNNSYNAYGGIVNAVGSLFDPYKNEKESLSTDLINILKGLV